MDDLGLTGVLQVKVFDDVDDLNYWLRDHSDTQIIDVKFNSVMLDGVITDRFLLLYKF